MKVAELPLPADFLAHLNSQGFVELFPPQEAAVKAGLLEGKNLLISSPTASGKTLIAMMAAFKKIRAEGRKVVYLSPLRALASEKYAEFKELEKLGVRCGISTGDFDSSGEGLARYDLLILTNEKFDSLLRHGISWLPSVGLFVSDEVHLAGSGDRGPTLEMILTNIIHKGMDVQLLSLSATVSNSQELARWLRSDLVQLDWRPVPLRQGVYTQGMVHFYNVGEKEVERSRYGPPIDVAMDSIGSGGQALIFASTRRRAVSLATKASEITPRYLGEAERLLCREAARKIRDSGEETGLSRLLADIVSNGAAFHHAGLSYEHRKIVEDYYRMRAIKLLSATPTLCLPAGEEVFGNPGPVQIQELVAGERVLTHGRSFEKVIGPTSRHYEGPLLKVTPWFQLPMRMTPEHKVLRTTRVRHSIHSKKSNRHWWTYSTPDWTEARNLKHGDLVLFPRIHDEVDLQTLPLPEMGPLRNQTGTLGKHWSRLKVDHIELTPRSLEQLGTYVAEGFTGEQGQVCFGLGTYETALTSATKEWLKTLGLTPRAHDTTRHRRRVYACSKQLVLLLRNLFGTTAPVKRIPHEFLLLPNQKLAHFIRGMWRGDGNVAKVGPKSARYDTTSKTLAKQLFAALVKMGYMPCINVSRRSGKRTRGSLGITHRHDLYTVSISGKQYHEFAEKVLLRQRRVVHVNREFNRGYIDDSFYYMPVRRIESEWYSGTVHNLEVEGHSSYVGSFVVHNSAGINMPARRVVVADLSRYDGELGMNSAISVLEYRQMAGRAGRPQYDDYGETVMIPPATYSLDEIVGHYIESDPEPIESRLGGERGMRVHLLAVIASRLGISREEIEEIFSKTLLAQQVDLSRIKGHLDDAMDYLFAEGLILEKPRGMYQATGFGKRVSTLYIDPKTGVMFRDSMKDFEGGMEAEGGQGHSIGMLHLIARTPDFEPKFPMKEKLYESAYEFLEKNRASMPKTLDERSFADYDETIQHMRTVMILNAWIEETKEDAIMEQLGAEPGDLHRAVDSADWLLYCLAELARLFGKFPVIKETNFLRKRVISGVREELVELTRLQGVGRVRARSLYNAGFKTVKAVREAPEERLAQVEKIGPTLARKIREASR